MIAKRRAKINRMCDKILKKNDQASMTLNQHIALWTIWLVLLGVGVGMMSMPLVTFKYLFVFIVFGLIIIGLLKLKKPQ